MLHAPHKKSSIKYFWLASVFLLSFCFVSMAHAATLSFEPQSSNISVGDIVSVKVFVNAGTSAVNVTEGSIEFPSDLLQVMSVNTNSSIFSLWVENPTFSNSAGTVTWNGGVPNPGFTGNGGEIMSVTFMAKKIGNASLLFSNSAVLANDGLGTDILSGSSSAEISISPATYKVNVPTITQVNPPTIGSYSRELSLGSTLNIHGTTYPNAAVSVFVKQNNVIIDTENTQSDSSGFFALAVSKRLTYGDYVFTAKVTDKNGVKSPETTVYAFTIDQNSLVLLGQVVINYASIIIVVALFIASIIGLSLRIFRKISTIKKEVKETETSLHKSFSLLKENIEKLTHLLTKAKTERSLTTEEKFFLEKFNPKITEIEKTVLKEIRDLENLK